MDLPLSLSCPIALYVLQLAAFHETHLATYTIEVDIANWTSYCK